MMLAVVLYHACTFFTGSWFDAVSPVYDAKYIAVFAKYLNTLHVQTFTMASGFLFYVLKKEKSRYCAEFKSGVGLNHAAVIAALNVEFYFALPHHPWQRGTNENTNGLLREYFPKSQDFSGLSDTYIQAQVNKLNLRPRKYLGYLSPYEVFFSKVLHLT